MIYIETPRLILRNWISSDIGPFLELNGDADVMEYFPSVLSREETLAQIERIKTHFVTHGYGLFAVERKDNGEFIGFTGLSHPRFESYFTPCVEVGWRLSKSNWGKGFATEAAKACIAYGFGVLKLNAIYSFTAATNNRSEQVMIKAGMMKQGTFDHPLLKEDDVLRNHILYKISRNIDL